MRMGMRSVFATLVALSLVACGDDGHNDNGPPPPPPPPTATVVDLGTVALTPTNQSQTFEVVVDPNASALVIVADGGDATDIDIERLKTPSGTELITAGRTDANPLTGTASPQETGQSVATAIVPSLSA